MIAMALACDPEAADRRRADDGARRHRAGADPRPHARAEATLGAAIMLITHDLGVVAEMAERVVVMYAGRNVEEATVARAIRAPAASLHAGAARRRARLGSALHGDRKRLAEIPGVVPSLNNRSAAACSPAAARTRPSSAAAAPALRGRRRTAHWAACHHASRGRRSPHERRPSSRSSNLKKHFPIRRRLPRHACTATCMRSTACRFSIRNGETLALVGESGCGKSTVGKLILGCSTSPPAKSVLRGGASTTSQPRELRPLRRAMQVVFQDPFSVSIRACACATSWPSRCATSGSPRRSRDRRRASPSCSTRSAAARAARPLAARILRRSAPAHRHRPRAGGGARAHHLRRAGIGARRLGPGADHQSAAGSPAGARPRLLFISHDLAIVEHISHRVAVMYLGRIVELADKRALFARPQHPYTEALLSAVPVPDPDRAVAAHHPAGRRAEPDQAADRLSFPHPLPLRRAALPRRDAAHARGGAGPHCRVPPARRDRSSAQEMRAVRCRGARGHSRGEAMARISPSVLPSSGPSSARTARSVVERLIELLRQAQATAASSSSFPSWR